MKGAPSALISLLALATALLAGCARGGPQSITGAELEEHVAYLASDELAGRLTGSPQISLAEEYIAGIFRSVGLSPVPGTDGYFLGYTAWRQGYDGERTFVRVRHDDSPIEEGRLGEDFRPFDFSSSGAAAAELVFAGYGITAPEHGYDDYRALDVRGKLVLVLRYEPNENDPASPFAGSRHTSHAYFSTKARNARAHGARGMLLFTTPLAHAAEEDFRTSEAYRLRPEELQSPQAGSAEGSFLALHISQAFAEGLALAAGTSIRELQRAVDSGTNPAAIPFSGLRAEVGVARAGAPEPVQARNVLGYLRGNRTDEIVLVGAHHDHIGAFGAANGADTIYNGADDNASGVAGVLELAEAFAARRGRPERSMVFATFSGEEQYLLGSAALLESGTVPPSALAFMLNLDMIGRNPGMELEVYGSESAPELRGLVESANQGIGIKLGFPASMPSTMDSDQSVFLSRGVPSLFLHTGLHEDYHGLDDEADRLDYAWMREVVSLAYGVMDREANPPR